MNSQEHPLITLFNKIPGCEQGDRWRVKMEERKEGDELQPLIKLGLGIGEYCNTIKTISRSTYDDNKWQKDKNFGRIVVKPEVLDGDEHDYDRTMEGGGCRVNSVVRFTGEQMNEFKRQLIIFKYMVRGLPVPIQLFPPLWRTPSLYVWRKGVSDRYWAMDPEPGRCRRTDGKKWRCYRSVVPSEKYCEKHMHRGRKRSRKLVEAPTTTLPNEDTDMSKKPNNDLGVELPGILDWKSQPLNEPMRNAVRPPDLTNNVAKGNDKVELNYTGEHRSIMKERIAAMSLASGTEFSPKSVLQDSQGYTGVGIRVSPLDVLQRCNRTDGKKWRCNHEALTGHKYCAQHVHRGLKKPLGALLVGRETKAVPVYTCTAKFTGQEQAKMGLHLDSDLKSSVHTNEDSVAGSSSSSDPGTETTVSDDGAEVSNLIALFP